MPVNMHGTLEDPAGIRAAVALLVGDPELVIVDFRVLRLLMGDLAGLLVLQRVMDADFHGLGPQNGDPGQESFAWDDESPCD